MSVIALALVLVAAPGATDAAETGRLVVFVFAPDGAPASDADVLIDGVPHRADYGGRLEVELPAGRHALALPGGERPVAVGRVAVVPGRESEALLFLDEGGGGALSVETPDIADEGAAASVEAAEVASASGFVDGVVTDLERGKPVADVKVLAKGGGAEATTDADGRFALELPAGEHALSFVHPLYSATVKAGVRVQSDATTIVEVQLTPTGGELPPLEVRAPHVEGSVLGAMDEKKNAGAITEVLGAQQMAQAGDSDAAAALSRVTGVTIVDGRYVYVRGLGERYSSTLLNGAPLPSPEPERRVVPLDLFPTSVLDSIVIQKTYSPELPGLFGGGAVGLRTEGVPDERTLSISLGTGGHFGTTFVERSLPQPQPLDLLGFDGGARALPDEVRAASEDQRLLEGDRFSDSGYSRDELEAFGESMGPMLPVERQLILPDSSASLEVGDRFDLGPVVLGYRGGLTWGNRTRYREESARYFVLGAGGELEPSHAYDFETAAREVGLGALLSTGAEIGADHSLQTTSFLGRLTDDETRIYEGENRDVGSDIRVARLRWVERSLLLQQVGGTHRFGALLGLDVGWQYTYGLALRHEPDRREVRYDNEPGTDRWLLSDRPEGNQRLFSDLTDHAHDVQVSMGLPFTQWNGLDSRVEVGGQLSTRARTVDTRRYKFQHKGAKAGDSSTLQLAPDEIFTPANIGTDGFQLEEISRQTDNYTAEEMVLGTYAHLDLPLFDFVRLAGGVRLEYADQQVSTFELFNPDNEPVTAQLSTFDVLPGGTLSVQLPFDMQLRSSGSVTVSRPDFRELSPATFNDVTGGRQVFGNPDLQRALIYSADARWEWYPLAGTSFSAAGFYKHFDSPIEQTVVLSAQQSLTFANAESADNVGAELEARFDLGLLHEWAQPFFVAGNGALIYSRVTLPDDGIQTSKERALQGQSPWVGNLQLGWDDTDLGTRAVLLYNVFGPRIVAVGAQGAPDVYEQPFHRLDLVLRQELPWGFAVSGKAKNLINLPRQYTIGDEVASTSLLGTEVSLSLSWSL